MRRIDLHCYPGTDEWVRSQGPYAEALAEYWNKPWVGRPEEEVVEDIRAAGLQAVLVAFDIESLTGAPACGNKSVAAMRDRHPDVFLGAWGAVDPLAGTEAVAEVQRAAAEDKVLGFHFHPIMGHYRVDDPRWHPAAAVPTAAIPAGPPAVATLTELIVRGPERIALTGPNGSGKTTLLRTIAGLTERPGLTIRLGAVTGYLPQRLDILDDSLSVVGNVRAAAPAASVNEVRASLARFLFRGDRAERLAGLLSGGERFRAVLAALLLAQPPPQLLLLDEPTNNLDMASVRQLSQALEGYRGAILVASHDVPFLRSAGITRWRLLDRDVGLAEVDPQ